MTNFTEFMSCVLQILTGRRPRCILTYLIIFLIFREGSDSEPVVKKRKTAPVVTNQPGQDNKVVVDNIPDNTFDQDQVSCDLVIINVLRH